MLYTRLPEAENQSDIDAEVMRTVSVALRQAFEAHVEKGNQAWKLNEMKYA